MRSRIYAGTPAAPDITKLDDEKVRDLMALCHPDRHDGSPRATRMFQWLVDVRKELDKKKTGA